MSSRKKRSYQSETRQTQAEQTKARILDAAKLLFQAKGFEDVKIEEIAKTANVSAPTVYALFQSKRGILRTLMDEALSPEQHATLVEQVGQEKSPKERLAITAKIARQLYDAERAQMDIFESASLLAHEFKELEQERERCRYERLRGGITRIAQENALAKGLSELKAHDIFWALTGRDMYRLFVLERGWTSDAYEKWLAQTLSKILLEDESNDMELK